MKLLNPSITVWTYPMIPFRASKSTQSKDVTRSIYFDDRFMRGLLWIFAYLAMTSVRSPRLRDETLSNMEAEPSRFDVPTSCIGSKLLVFLSWLSMM